MHVYGQFPTQEDFCLVVCHVCNQVVKPQGILTHYKKRHGSPCPSRAPLVPVKPKMSAVASSTGDTLAFRVPRDYPHGRFSKAPLAVYPPKGARGKTCVSLPVVSLEKMPCLGRAEVGGTNGRLNTSFSTASSSTSSTSSSSLSPAKPSLTPASSHRSGEKVANGRGPVTPHSTASPSSTLDSRSGPGRSPLDRQSSSTPSPSILDRRPSSSPSPRPSAPPSPLDRKQQNGARINKPPRRLSGERVQQRVHFVPSIKVKGQT
ncbi:ataxin-7-like protein 1 [Aplochiton taeniatus]